MSEITNVGTMLRISITGVEQLVSNFAMLPRGVASKYVDSGMKKHMEQYKPDLKARTTKGPSGNLKKSVIAKGEYKAPYRVMGLVGFSTKNGKKGYHAHFLEKGTAVRAPKSAPSLAIPDKFGSRYRYLKKAGFFFKSVRGMPKTGFFNAWQKSKRKTFVIGLETLLLESFNKGVAEVARRPG